MKSIEISEQVYRHLLKNMQDFGETPDNVLKRLLHITEKTSDSVSPRKGFRVTSFSWKNVDFWEGMQLRARNNSNIKAIVRKGSIELDGEKFTSPSAAAVYANNETSTNGWIYWEYLDEMKGTWSLIDSLRPRV